MERIEIILTRGNLLKRAQNVPSNEATVYDFKLTRDQINRARRIVFKDNGQEFVFKEIRRS